MLWVYLGLPIRFYWHVTDTLPLRDELFCRTAMFVSKCVTSENSIVNFVSRHGVYFRRVSSPIGRNTQLCCVHFDVPLHRLTSINRNNVRRYVYTQVNVHSWTCLLYTSPSPRDRTRSRMPSSA